MFPNEEIIEDFSALNYLIDHYFPKCKLAMEVDELGYKDRDQTKKNKRQKDLKEYLDCELNRINPDEKDFSAYDDLVKYRHLLISQKKINKRIQRRSKRIQSRNKRIQRRSKRTKRQK